MTMDRSTNPATVWAEALAEGLAGAGVQHVSLAPGSRSTALVLAFAAHPALRIWRHLDERSAAFFALGIGMATNRPAVVLATSGTATANFFPAIVEARMAGVPLLVITADRPPELRHSGANQTIDQVKLYGDQVLWSVDLPLPEAEAPEVVLRNVRVLAARAAATALGLPPGPVHLNAPFRKPFEPLTAEPGKPAPEPERKPGLVMARGRLLPTEAQVALLAQMIADHPRGIIVAGPRREQDDGFGEALARLARFAGYPIFADPLSGVRFGSWVAGTAVLGGYDTYLMEGGPGWAEPQLVLRFGALPTSRWLNEYLQRIRPAHRVHVRESGVWADDSHTTTLFLQADEVATCAALQTELATRRRARGWGVQLQATEGIYWQVMRRALANGDFDGAFVNELFRLLPAHSHLFVGNSLPIRHVDQFVRPRARPLHLYGNRGASGIDGNVSTALGIAAATEEPVVLLAGDITFYHDMNGLLAAKQHDLKLIAVVLNNDGGGIFRRLPVARIEPPFTELFVTPHGLDFEPAAALYGLAYERVTKRAAFREAFRKALAGDSSYLIEVHTDGRADHERRQELIASVLAEVRGR
jgi:2-succinyl-5-enolpyruvyl-6-hydroxy-3-cyclohexene-1-carboxylate synthase